MVDKTPTPEILPPEPTGIVRSRFTPKQKRLAIVGISSAGLVWFILWGFNEFTSIRGVFNMLMSRIILVSMFVAGVLCITLWVWGLQAAYKRTLVICLSLVWGGALLALEWSAPRPKLTVADNSNDKAKSDISLPTKTEAQKERELLDQLREKYITRHPDKVTPALVAGREDPPADWLNSELAAMGEKFRFSAAPNRPASTLEQPSLEGFHEKPDRVTFSLGEGGMIAGLSLKLARAKPMTPFIFGEYTPFTATMQGDKLLFNFKVWNGTAEAPVEVVNNSFTVRTPVGWDRNSSPNALEVVNAKGKPVFQMIRKTPTDIAINGIFPLPNGRLVIAGPNGSEVGASEKDVREFSLKPIFRYPSWKFPSKYADDSN